MHHFLEYEACQEESGTRNWLRWCCSWTSGAAGSWLDDKSKAKRIGERHELGHQVGR